jgi:hypothetical protein
LKEDTLHSKAHRAALVFNDETGVTPLPGIEAEAAAQDG